MSVLPTTRSIRSPSISNSPSPSSVRKRKLQSSPSTYPLIINNYNSPTISHPITLLSLKIKFAFQSTFPRRRVIITKLYITAKWVGKDIIAQAMGKYTIGTWGSRKNNHRNYIRYFIIKHIKMPLKAFHHRGLANSCPNIPKLSCHIQTNAITMWQDL